MPTTPRRSSSPPPRPSLSFPCSCFSHAPLAALLVPPPAIPPNRVSFGKRAHAEADQNKCPQVARRGLLPLRASTPSQAHRHLSDHHAPTFCLCLLLVNAAMYGRAMPRVRVPRSMFALYDVVVARRRRLLPPLLNRKSTERRPRPYDHRAPRRRLTLAEI